MRQRQRRQTEPDYQNVGAVENEGDDQYESDLHPVCQHTQKIGSVSHMQPCWPPWRCQKEVYFVSSRSTKKQDKPSSPSVCHACIFHGATTGSRMAAQKEWVLSIKLTCMRRAWNCASILGSRNSSSSEVWHKKLRKIFSRGKLPRT